MTPEAQKWRDHFDLCEKDQLRRFPLCLIPLRQLETPLLRSQYQIALAYFQKIFPLEILHVFHERDKEKPRDERSEVYRKATAFWADRATREAFYEHFALEPLQDFFCLRTEEWKQVFQLENSKDRWENRYSMSWHEFIALSTMTPKELRARLGASLPEDIPLETLFLRDFGDLVHPLGGDGGSDLWRFDGNELVFVRSVGGWVS